MFITETTSAKLRSLKKDVLVLLEETVPSYKLVQAALLFAFKMPNGKKPLYFKIFLHQSRKHNHLLE